MGSSLRFLTSRRWAGSLAAVAVALSFFATVPAGDDSDLLPSYPFEEKPLPAFDEPRESRWINSAPLTREELAGKVVVVEFWTFGCVNCVRSIPWVVQLQERYGEDLVIVGVHTPEFDFEHEINRVRKFAEKRGLTHPILIDNGYRYWDKLENRYWPAFWLADRDGVIRHVGIGETHPGSLPARDFEARIDALLEE